MEAKRRGQIRDRGRDSDMLTLIKLWRDLATRRERRERKYSSFT